MNLLIGANFKMNKTGAELREYLGTFTAEYKNIETVDVMIAPVMTGLSLAGELVKDSCIHLGAQNMSSEISGAFTGETSPLSLQEFGCEYVILGHSERRTIFGETDELVNKKLKTALAHNIRPILCIGENLAQKEEGLTKDILRVQLEKGLAGIEDTTGIDIAYEPVWAIGTGKSATPEYAEEIHMFIREILGQTKSRIIYGGSVTEVTAHELISKREINGFLIGSAALDPRRLMKIIEETVR
ncbi:triose-phosphate isomerase [Candidatus Gracilibacteria bacterium]|nr:triose-phosphate isomerase [bacterium]NDK19769.1 triose-phosphate isomerase [Candidatus Gracilibacteria bacterium]OIO76366.1 MAG: triose-phosphate isomerase [Candidatus Gracilibacteria bacterium CG1_02_38_174]PIQ11420.1 MAG: triose-phosphate isomerase [Candidatus Gracilibacteria bacterium CG18_big_fil_WC_8_21_14_2_50_38_16]PIQ41060.1 MAG: triose-phosphate isomerase [Candidatus Gracilibacteria bacterium CG12_big_fil_rev_8_21_14_0_65_38_15]PIZ01297.1 MAG: triose-phosphate isomerase [Candidatu